MCPTNKICKSIFKYDRDNDVLYITLAHQDLLIVPRKLTMSLL